MIRVCAWCGKELPPTVGEEGLVTHGICEECSDAFISTHPIDLVHYLDRLKVPVVLVDEDVNVRTMNKMAVELTGKKRGEFDTASAGSVFDCHYAHLPEGCGRSIHCSGCTIRRAIDQTWQTGEPQSQIPATLTKSEPDSSEATKLAISTRKWGDMVLLKIDAIG